MVEVRNDNRASPPDDGQPPVSGRLIRNYSLDDYSHNLFAATAKMQQVLEQLQAEDESKIEEAKEILHQHWILTKTTLNRLIGTRKCSNKKPDSHILAEVGLEDESDNEDI